MGLDGGLLSTRRTANEAAHFHNCEISCLESVPELLLMNANAPSALYLASPSRSIRLCFVGEFYYIYGMFIIYGIVLRAQDLWIGTQGQFCSLLVVACGENATFEAK